MPVACSQYVLRSVSTITREVGAWFLGRHRAAHLLSAAYWLSSAGVVEDMLGWYCFFVVLKGSRTESKAHSLLSVVLQCKGMVIMCTIGT